MYVESILKLLKSRIIDLKSNVTKLKTTNSPVLVSDADGLSRLNVHFVMVTGTLCHGDTDAIFI